MRWKREQGVKGKFNFVGQKCEGRSRRNLKQGCCYGSIVKTNDCESISPQSSTNIAEEHGSGRHNYDLDNEERKFLDAHKRRIYYYEKKRPEM